jgi:exopolysaccharide biosynthesis polyprenyl glycosylphosphotransferase
MIFQRKSIVPTLAKLSNAWPAPVEGLDPGSQNGRLLRPAGPRKKKSKQSPGAARPAVKTKLRHHRERWEAALTVVALLGDYLSVVAGFALTDLVCQTSLIPSSITGILPPGVQSSYKLILTASLIILWRLRGKSLYTYRHLLLPSKIWHTMMGATGVSLSAFVALSLVVKTNPIITWKYLVCSIFIILPMLCLWRLTLSRIIRVPALASRLRHRLVVIGGGSQALRIQKSLGEHSDMEFIGWIEAIKPNHVAELEDYRLGPLHELRNILRNHAINTAVLVESESLQRDGVVAVTKVCEKEHVQFNMVPHFFEVLVSAVRPGNIGEMQLLGVHCLPLHGLRNRVLKRTMDIFGAIVGLTISIPLMMIFGTMVFIESPGPILYRQIREGRHGRRFHIIKLRSMRLNAEADGKAQWARNNDHRRLRIGAFMRKWNIDEIPQFWNVLRGEMSLVGPRPERPELIARFESTVPHYQARHMYQPGMTGWAQINGWRGNTDLEERIRHDIWYLENWSLWLDFRIMAETLFRRDNAY